MPRPALFGPRAVPCADELPPIDGARPLPEKGNPMRRLAPVLAAAAMGIACSLPGGVSSITAPAASQTVMPPTASPTASPVPPTAIPPSPTPAPAPITLQTVGELSIYASFGEGETIRDLAFSPDGEALASVAGNREDFAIRLWDAGTGQPLRELVGHASIVFGLAFSPDGTMLASASKDHTAKIWDWRSGALLKSLDLPNEVTSVAFSPDSRTLAVGGVDVWPNAAVWTWSVDSWAPSMELAEFWNIPALSYSPDGEWLAGGGTSRNTRLWRTSDGEAVQVLHHPGQVSSVVVSPDGATVATGLCETADEALHCTRGAVRLWNLHTGTLIKSLADFPDWVEGVVFSEDGSVLIAGSRDGTLRAYSTSDFAPLFATLAPGGVMALAISLDGRFLATGSRGPDIHLWRVEP